MYRTMRVLIKIVISAAVSLLILSSFVYFYNNQGVHINDPSGATDYKWEPEQIKNTMVEGFAFFRMDRNGYNNKTADTDNIDILLMGSSQMEATNVSQDYSTASVMNTILPLYTYNIGVSGHTIYHCLQNIEHAVGEYRPHSYVVLVIDEIMLDTSSMQQVIDGTLEKIPSYDSGLVYTLQKRLPVIKVLYKAVLDWIDAEKREKAKESPAIGSRVCEENGLSLIIVYQPKTNLDNDGRLVYQNEKAVDAFAQTCFAQSILFLDMTESFDKLYDERNILAHGFTNTAVGSGHLNKYGHALIARELAKAIQGGDCPKTSEVF